MTLQTNTHPKHLDSLQRSAAIDQTNVEIEQLCQKGLTRNEARLVVKFRKLQKRGNGLRMFQIIMDGNSPPTIWRLEQDGTMLKE